MNGMEKAIEVAGDQVKLAENLGVSQSAISLWKSRGYPPKNRVRDIVALTGVPARELIDPDIVDLMTDPADALGAEDEDDISDLF